MPVFAAWCEDVASRLGGGSKERVLQKWLEGYGLPAIDTYTEASTWLIDAVNEKPSLEEDVAAAAAGILGSFLDGTLESQNQERLLFNLFYLCAGLRNPRLGPLLWAVLEKSVASSTGTTGNFGNSLRESQYREIPLLMAFEAALAENQTDNRLVSVWRRMLGEKPNVYLRDSPFLNLDREAIVEYLDGLPIDGFEGILELPGPPDEALIGWALGRLAAFLSDGKYRRRQFQELLNRVESQFDSVKWDFGALAARCEWPCWPEEEGLVQLPIVPPPPDESRPKLNDLHCDELHGQPNEYCVGWFLRRVADSLHDGRNRDKEFQGILNQMRSRFVGAKWNFGNLAYRCQWPQWTEKFVVKEAPNIAGIRLHEESRRVFAIAERHLPLRLEALVVGEVYRAAKPRRSRARPR